MKRCISVILCCMVMLAACGQEQDAPEESVPESSLPSPEPSIASLPDLEPSSSDSEPDAVPEEPPANPLSESQDNALLRPLQRRLEGHGIAVRGGSFATGSDHTFSFILLLERENKRYLQQVSGTYAEDALLRSPIGAATWGGVSLLDNDTLAVYTGNKITLLAKDGLDELATWELDDYREDWVLGICKTADGYAAAVGGTDFSRIVYLDREGAVAKTLDLYDPSYFQKVERNYWTEENRYEPGFALTAYPGMGTISFDSPRKEYILLEQDSHTSWVSDDGVGQLDTYLLLEQDTGEILKASEQGYYLESDRRYTFLNYTGSDPDNKTGYMGMLFVNGQRKAAIAFQGPPSYITMGGEEYQWRVDGNRVEIDNPNGSQYVVLDFGAMAGSTEFRFTADDLGDRILAVSPSGRYVLHGVNVRGAGDGYWGQVVLFDSQTGAIDYVRNMPIRYGGDEESANFSDDGCFTTADGNTLQIFRVDAPDRYRTVELALPERNPNALYCNSIYDIQNDRYFMAYADQVGIDNGGWHEYENAFYRVAVFDSGLQLIEDVAVPGVAITHSLYAMPCPSLTWDGATLLLNDTPVDLSQA